MASHQAKILVTGVGSGLGKYIHQELGGLGLTRQNSEEVLQSAKKSGVDVIIHCAFNPRSDFFSDSFADYIGDNILLTYRLAEIPHRQFIYVSSIDVYPISKTIHTEDEAISANQVSGIYGITKLASESIVQRGSKKFLILRGVGFLGACTRKNSCQKIIEDDPCELTLTADSVFNYVRHADILDFIRLAIQNGTHGIYNLASSQNITLKEVANFFKKKVKYGSHRYDVGEISNQRIAQTSPAFQKTSMEAVVQFAEKDLGVKSIV